MNKSPASIRWKKARGCTYKVRYVDAESAEMARITLGRERAYHCEYCQGWHLTGKMPEVGALIQTPDDTKEKTACGS